MFQEVLADLKIYPTPKKTSLQPPWYQKTDPQKISYPVQFTPSYRQGEYDIALVDREGNQLYFGSFSLSQVDSVEVCILSVMLWSGVE